VEYNITFYLIYHYTFTDINTLSLTQLHSFCASVFDVGQLQVGHVQETNLIEKKKNIKMSNTRANFSQTWGS
jgi:hypothetical protein